MEPPKFRSPLLSVSSLWHLQKKKIACVAPARHITSQQVRGIMRGGGRRVHRRVRGRAPNANLSRAKGAANARFALRALLASALRLRNAVRMLVSAL